MESVETQPSGEVNAKCIESSQMDLSEKSSEKCSPSTNYIKKKTDISLLPSEFSNSQVDCIQSEVQKDVEDIYHKLPSQNSIKEKDSIVNINDKDYIENDKLINGSNKSNNHSSGDDYSNEIPSGSIVQLTSKHEFTCSTSANVDNVKILKEGVHLNSSINSDAKVTKMENSISKNLVCISTDNTVDIIDAMSDTSDYISKNDTIHVSGENVSSIGISPSNNSDICTEDTPNNVSNPNISKDHASDFGEVTSGSSDYILIDNTIPENLEQISKNSSTYIAVDIPENLNISKNVASNIDNTIPENLDFITKNNKAYSGDVIHECSDPIYKDTATNIEDESKTSSISNLSIMEMDVSEVNSNLSLSVLSPAKVNNTSEVISDQGNISNCFLDNAQLNSNSIDGTNCYLVDNIDVSSEINGEACVMQRVVEGTLQPLDIHTLDADGKIRDTALFAGVSQEMQIGNSASHIEGIIIDSVMETDKSVLELTSENEVGHLMDLTSPLVSVENSLDSSHDLPSNKKIKLDTDNFIHNSYEGKPVLLKVCPLKNGTGLWGIDDIKFALGERGCLLLKICAASEAADEDLAEGPVADFTALFLEDSFDVPDIPFIPPDYDMKSFYRNSFPNKRSFNRAFNSPPYKTSIEEEFYEKFGVPGDFGEYIPSFPVMSPKRKCLPPPKGTATNNAQFGLTRRGRRRGRPPLHNKRFPAKLGRPPKKKILFPDDNKFNALPISTSNSRINNADINDTKDNFLDILDKKIENSVNQHPAKAFDKDSYDSGELKISSKLNCAFCNSVFCKKSAIIAHMKLKHENEKRCPLCKETVEQKGKCDMKHHILKVHKDGGNINYQYDADFKSEKLLNCHVKMTPISTSDSSDSENVLSRLKSTKTTSKKGSISESAKGLNKNLQNDSNCVITKDIVKGSDDSFLNTNSKLLKSSGTKECMKKEDNINLISKKEAEKSSNSGDESGNESDNESSSGSEIEERKRYFCKVCNVGFSHKFKLSHHQKTHSDTPDEEEEVGSSSEAEKNQEEDESESLNCKECGKACRSTYQLKLHKIQHNLTKKMKKSESVSTNAEHSFVKKVYKKPKSSNLLYAKTDSEVNQEEQQNVECFKKNERPSYIVRRGRILFCTKCNVSFKKEKQMTYHLKKIHETMYPFRACPDCGRIFRSYGPYTRHISTHKGKKCPVPNCKAKYRHLRLVWKHQRHSHPEFPFRCHRCVQLFEKDSQLQKHLREGHVSNKKQKNYCDEPGNESDAEEGSEEEEEKEIPTKTTVATRSKTNSPSISKKTPGKGIVKKQKHVVQDESDYEQELTEKSDEEPTNIVSTRSRDKRISSTALKKEMSSKVQRSSRKQKYVEENETSGEESEKEVDNKTVSLRHRNKRMNSSVVTRKQSTTLTQSSKNQKYIEESESTAEEESGEDVKKSSRTVATRSRDRTVRSLSSQKKQSSVKEPLSLRRLRMSPVSYREQDEEEDGSIQEKLSIPNLTKRSIKNKRPSVSSNEDYSLIKKQMKTLKPALPVSKNIVSPSNNSISKAERKTPVKKDYKPHILLGVKKKRALQKKRVLHRKFPLTKHIDTSWTAALKAQYKDNLAMIKKAKIEARAIKKAQKLAKKPKNSSVYNPAITEDVVRRVAESLLVRQQEQISPENGKKSTFVHSTPILQPSHPNYSTQSNQEESFSSFDDTSNLPPDHPPARHQNATRNVPDQEDDDDGPANVIRFDSF